MSKHTPGPLLVAYTHEGGCRIAIDDEPGLQGLRNYDLFTVTHGDPDELAANAARLVTCWNSHDAMLAALREAERLLDSVAFVSTEGDTTKPLRKIRAAIAKATGEQS